MDQARKVSEVLPPELLAEIFQLCVFSPPEPPDALTFTKRLQELRYLSSVSSRWRDVAINTPFLWSSIAIVPTCTIHSLDIGRSIWSTEFARLYEMVRPHLRRCSTLTPLTLFVDPTPPASLQSMELTGAAVAPTVGDALQRLSLSHGLFHPTFEWMIPFLESWSNLTSLTLDTRSLESKAPAFRVLLPRLKFLSQEPLSADKYIDAPGLTRLRWTRMNFRDSSETFSFPLVRTLSIQYPPQRILAQVSGRSRYPFDIPMLEEIELDGAHAIHLLSRFLLPRNSDSRNRIPFPNLRRLGLWLTYREDLGELRDLFALLLNSYPSMRLQYQEGKTWPREDKLFWADLGSRFGDRVFSRPQSDVLLPTGPHKRRFPEIQWSALIPEDLE
ncbi:hypothetical protein DL93DRAFT_1212183 [Clavulina sp. PMI_390]|nr:hypothetical protein DL93DRAFT_1212183 [Clavulina sp. PMI_390]